MARNKPIRLLTSFSVLGALTVLALPVGAAEVHKASIFIREIKHDVSPALRDIPPQAPAPGRRFHEVEKIPFRTTAPEPDAALQTSVTAAVATTAGLNVAGVGVGLASFSPNSVPPDTTAAVGATQYVQWVNTSFAVFNKSTGALVYGPAAGSTLWSGFGGGCQSNNDGDPIVTYDKLAGRWVMAQFSVSTTPYLECVAVSKTSDATGQWYRYAFSYSNFDDYPKIGVWPDGYYVTYNMFSSSFLGAKVCVMDRNAMLAGAAATQQCVQLGTSYGGLLPADLDGSTAPPAGSPNYVLNFGTNSLNLWKFYVDWATPSNTRLVGPTNVSVASFSPACNAGNCIPQLGTAEKLDSLADRLMYRLAYRNFGTYESMVVNHSVTTPSAASGIRWYELRNPGGTPSVFQSGTFSPDANSRWMGSVAMDKQGNVAVGYSISSKSMYPSIRYTVRAAGDPLGQLSTSETTVVNGGGFQKKYVIYGNDAGKRWGDYSSMTVDPVDDCTFWYSTEYLKSSGTFNWSTRIASFKVQGCQ